MFIKSFFCYKKGKIDNMTDVTLYNITFTHTHAHNYMMLQDMKECIQLS